MGHQNRGRLTVNLNGNWRLHTNALPSNATAIGTIDRGNGNTGALIKTGAGIFAQLNANTVTTLDQRKVLAAINGA